jgi:hypothetical protein
MTNISQILNESFTEKVDVGIKDGLIDCSKIDTINKRPIYTNYRENYPVSEIKNLYGYDEDILQVLDDDSGLYFLYERSKDDKISTLFFKALVEDNEGNKWKIISTSTNPHIKEAYLNSYTKLEQNMYRTISPEVFGAKGNGNDDTDAFEAMSLYMGCMSERIVLLRSRYLITRNIYLKIPMMIIGKDDLMNVYKSCEEKNDFDDLKNYPYGIVMDNCGIVASIDESFLQYSVINENKDKMYTVTDNSHFGGLANHSTGLMIRIADVLIINKRILDDEDVDRREFLSFMYDSDFVSYTDVVSVAVDLIPLKINRNQLI